MAQRKSKPIDPADKPFPWEPMLETSVFDPWWERTLKGGARALIPSTPREMANELFLSALPLGPVLSKLASKLGPPTRRAVQRFVNPPHDPSRREALRNIGPSKTVEQIAKRKEVFGTSRPPMDTAMTGFDDLIQEQLGGKNLSLAELADEGGFIAREEMDIMDSIGDLARKHLGGKNLSLAELAQDPMEERALSYMAGPRFASKEVPFRPEYIDFGSVSGRFEKAVQADLAGIESEDTIRALQDIGRRYSQDIPRRGGILGDVIEHGKRLSREIAEGVAEETGEVIQKEAPDPAIKKGLDSLLRRLGVPRGKL
jgi:hypothetical protein